MAQVISSNQPIELDLAGGTNYKDLVCLENATLAGASETSTTQTDCGNFTSVADPIYTLTGTGVCETAPTVDQISYEELLTAFVNKTQISALIQNPTVSGSSIGTAYYHAFDARITALELQKPDSASYVKFTFTIVSDGSIDITA